MKKRGRLWTLIVSLVLVLALGGIAFACITERFPYVPGFSVPPSTGIEEGRDPEKVRVTYEEARRRFPAPIANLPQVAFEQPCGNGLARIRLIRVWADNDEVLLYYSHALWLRVTLPAAASDKRTLGIPVVPRRIESGRVRGRTAEITQHGWKRKYFFCGTGFKCDGMTREEVSGTSWHSLGAELHWVENGVDVRLQGPYPASVLIELAEKLRFDRSS